MGLRGRVMMRDGGDLFAGVSGKKCVAAHLDPVTRPDVSEVVAKSCLCLSLTGHCCRSTKNSSTSSSCTTFRKGLAMERSLHRAYKAYRWSIYCKAGLSEFVMVPKQRAP